MSKIKSKINLISLILLSYLSLISCILELPLTYKNTKGVSNKAKKIDSEPLKYFRLGETISYDEAPLTLNDNFYFLTTVKIGSSEEKYNLILETGSNNLWVVQGRVRANSMKVSRSYNPSTSTTSKNTNEPFQLNYGSAGSLSGTFYTDQFKFIGNKVFNMKFGVATRLNINANYGTADGVIGLGHSYEDEEMSFIHMLKENEVTDSKLFSIKLDNDADIEEDGATGKLYIGKHEDFSSDNVVSCPLITGDEESDRFWTFQIDGIGLKKSNKEIKSSRSYNVILETATNNLILPYKYLRDIERDLEGFGCDTYRDFLSSYYEIRCPGEIDTLPDFQLNINGTILTIPAKYIFELSEVNYYARIHFIRNQETYIIGSPFLFAYHTLFDGDNEKLHFYPNFEEKNDEKENEEEEEGKEDEKEDEKDKDKEKEKDKDKEKEDEKEKDKDKEDEKDKDKEKEKDKDKEKEKDEDKEKEDEKEDEKENDKDKEDEKEDEKENDKDKEDEKDKDGGKNNDRNKTKTNDTEPGTDKKGEEPKKKKKSKSKLWIIIPCVIGGIILLVGLGVLIYFCMKSKNAKKDGEDNNADNNEPIVDNNEDNEDN